MNEIYNPDMDDIGFDLDNGVNQVHPNNDPRATKLLFSIYKQLANPLKNIEAMQEKLDADLSSIMDDKEDITKSSCISYFFAFLLNPGWKILIAIEVLLLIFVIVFSGKGGFIGEIATVLDHNYLLMYVITPLIILSIISLAFVLINLKLTKDDLKKCETEATEINEQLTVRVEEISEIMTLIPPKYRYSVAVEKFAEYYENHRAMTLQQAVNLFETEKYREQMLQQQAEIVNKLENIEFMQAMQVEELNRLDRKLSSLRRDVWGSKLIL